MGSSKKVSNQQKKRRRLSRNNLAAFKQASKTERVQAWMHKVQPNGNGGDVQQPPPQQQQQQQLERAFEAALAAALAVHEQLVALVSGGKEDVAKQLREVKDMDMVLAVFQKQVRDLGAQYLRCFAAKIEAFLNLQMFKVRQHLENRRQAVMKQSAVTKSETQSRRKKGGEARLAADATRRGLRLVNRFVCKDPPRLPSEHGGLPLLSDRRKCAPRWQQTPTRPLCPSSASPRLSQITAVPDATMDDDWLKQAHELVAIYQARRRSGKKFKTLDPNGDVPHIIDLLAKHDPANRFRSSEYDSDSPPARKLSVHSQRAAAVRRELQSWARPATTNDDDDDNNHNDNGKETRREGWKFGRVAVQAGATVAVFYMVAWFLAPQQPTRPERYASGINAKLSAWI
ncbi:hypothetical protein BKA81DRAFT_383168 [Phyllosticta paracitricarpa]